MRSDLWTLVWNTSWTLATSSVLPSSCGGSLGKHKTPAHFWYRFRSCHWIALQCKWIIRILPYYFTSLWNYLEWNGICELNLIHPIVSVPRAPWVFLYTHSHHMWCPCDDMCGLNMDLWKTTHLAFKKQQLPRVVSEREVKSFSHLIIWGLRYVLYDSHSLRDFSGSISCDLFCIPKALTSLNNHHDLWLNGAVGHSIVPGKVLSWLFLQPKLFP